MNLSVWLKPPWYGGRCFAIPPIEHECRRCVEGALVLVSRLHLCNDIGDIRRDHRHVPPGDISYVCM